MGQAPSIKDVARESGVSYKTVSRVINGEDDVSPTTRARVQEAITALGYRPHHAARSLRSGRTATLGFIIHHRTDRFLSNPFMDELVAGVVDAAARSGYAVLLDLEGRQDRAQPRAALSGRRVDGTVVLDARTPSPLVPQLRATGAPSVVLANRELDPSIGWIDADFRGGAERLMRHLLDLRHRTIAHLTDDPALASTRGRRRGYEAALTAAGIAVDPQLMVLAGHLRDHGYAATERIMTERPDVTALFCVNDLTAFGAIDWLRGRGLRVPEDVSVTGYDDIAQAPHSDPPLTTVHLPWYEMGTAAVELVIGAVEQTRPFPLGMEFPVELRLRASAGPVRA